MTASADLLGRWIGRPGEDPGCDRSFETFDQFVEAALAGEPLGPLFPGSLLHLERCPDCREDFVALREVVLLAGENPAGR